MGTKYSRSSILEEHFPSKKVVASSSLAGNASYAGNVFTDYPLQITVNVLARYYKLQAARKSGEVE